MDAKFLGLYSDEELEVVWQSESASIFNEYLALQEESETPRDYLIWSLIAFAAGLLGRNAVLRFGPNLTITPNLFVILLGPSRMRKSSAISMTASLMTGTTLNYCPTDTGAQRHGIMRALTGLQRNVDRHAHYPIRGPMVRTMTHPRKPDDMMIVAQELGRLLGQGSIDMMNFMNDLYDGVPIDYQTKAGETYLQSPLASLLGATTPQNLASILPDSSTGHGILGRIIFVYADRIHKQVPLPPEVNEEWYEAKQKITQRFTWIDENRQDFSVSESARSEYERLYSYIPEVADPRLENYRGGRTTILMKVAMIIAALRYSTLVDRADVILAHSLLARAEPTMHKALEYFGRNKAYVGRMLILEFLRHSPTQTCSTEEALAAAMSELNQREATEALTAMISSGELVKIGNQLTLPTATNVLRTPRSRDAFKKGAASNEKI